jgi:ABC-type amino acid transport substrate-binding protein
VAGKSRDFVFISYSKSRRELTKSLAEDLEAAGYDTWWDTELVAGDNYRKEIDRRLKACAAAIIIWTPEAIESEWVMSEAGDALRRKKLINTHVPELSTEDIPKPFDQRHSVEVADRAAIIRAVGQRIAQSRVKGNDKPAVVRRKTAKSAAKDLPPVCLFDDKQTDDQAGKRGRGRTSPRWAGLALGLAAIAALAVGAFLLWAPSGSAAPQWTFANKPFFLGDAIPLEWSFTPASAGSLRFEIQSASDEDFEADAGEPLCTDSNPYLVRNVNATRYWRVRAVSDCTARTPQSAWSEPVKVTQFESAYDRIAATGTVDIYVSNSQDQDLFKWGDHGFDIMLGKLIVSALGARMGKPLGETWTSVDWKALLPEARERKPDFVISSITRTDERMREYRIAFSQPYFCTGYALLYRMGVAPAPIGQMITGRTVGVQSQSTNATLGGLLAQDGSFKLETFRDLDSLIDALFGGRIDFAIVDEAFARSAQLKMRLANGMDRLAFEVFGPADVPAGLPGGAKQEYAIAVPDIDVQLLAAIDETIAKAKEDGTLADFYKRAAAEYEATHGKGRQAGLGERPWVCRTATAAGYGFSNSHRDRDPSP